MQLACRSFTVPLIVGLVICLLISVFFTVYIYHQTKKSYWSVGFNDGSIDARLAVLESINGAIGEIGSCHELDEGVSATEILSVKTDSLVLVNHVDGRISFCKW
jgi:hypothetical protein